MAVNGIRRRPGCSSLGLHSSRSGPNRWLGGKKKRRRATKETRPKKKKKPARDLSRRKGIASEREFGPGCLRSCSGARCRHSWTTLRDTGTGKVVSQCCDPWPCPSPPPLHAPPAAPPSPSGPLLSTLEAQAEIQEMFLQQSGASQTRCKSKTQTTVKPQTPIGTPCLHKLGLLSTNFRLVFPTLAQPR